MKLSSMKFYNFIEYRKKINIRKSFKKFIIYVNRVLIIKYKILKTNCYRKPKRGYQI